MTTYQRKKRFLATAIAALLMMSFSASSFAAGSRNLVVTDGTGDDKTGFRPYIEWYDGLVFHAGGNSANNAVKRQQSILVYAKAGETICFGSSVFETEYNATTGKKVNRSDDLPTIRMTDVAGRVNYYNVAEDGKGFISFAQEPYGPNVLNVNGYDAFTYLVPQNGEGIYTFQFFATLFRSDRNPQRVLVNKPDAWAAEDQATGVAAWDVTVVDGGGQEKTGRTFANYLTMTLGNNDNVGRDFLKSKVHVLTDDGYIYETDFNGMNPNGFLFFGNNRGLVDMTTGNSLYHSTLYPDNTLTHLLANTGFHSPAEPDTALDITYEIFFEYPSSEYLAYRGLSTPKPPATIRDFSFNGGNAVQAGAGGNFTFTADKSSSFQIEIMFNNDPDNVIYVANTGRKGLNSYHWDGKDYYGNVAPNGTYMAKLTVKAGEYHFPFADAEVNRNGIQVKLENTPAEHDADFDPYTVYYDNSSKTINGEYLDFDPLPTAPDDVYYGPLTALDGVSSKKDRIGISNALRYTTNKTGNVAASGYGNLKLFDVWTYFSSQAYIHTTPVVVSDPAPGEGVPKTGDGMPLLLWTILLIGSATGLCIQLIRRRSKRSN